MQIHKLDDQYSWVIFNPFLMKSHRAQKLIPQSSYDFQVLMIYQSPKQSLRVRATARGGLTCGLA